MDDAYKINYLLDAMRGEARQSLKQLEISGKTYAMAVEHLKKKYGNAQLIIRELVERLEKTRAKSRKMENQRRLCEELSWIVNQMELKGEMIDSSTLQRQILSKFTEATQRAALKRKQELAEEEPWNTKMLLSVIQSHINNELEINRHIDSRERMSASMSDNRFSGGTAAEEERQQIPRNRSSTCFYCEKTITFLGIVQSIEQKTKGWRS